MRIERAAGVEFQRKDFESAERKARLRSRVVDYGFWELVRECLRENEWEFPEGFGGAEGGGGESVELIFI